VLPLKDAADEAEAEAEAEVTHTQCNPQRRGGRDVEAETLHPLVVATIAAKHTLEHSKDPNAAGARWSLNTRYIGEKEAFIVFYNAHEISSPRAYLRCIGTVSGRS